MSSKLLLQALRGEPVIRPPFWYMRQAGRYLPEYLKLRQQQPDFLQFCYTPELTVAAALQPIERFGMDAAILFSDILVIADALGRDLRFVDGQGPVLEPLDPDDVAGLTLNAIDNRLAPVYTAVETLKAALPEGIALIGFAGAPWTVAVYMIEGHGGGDCGRARTWAYADPDGFGQLMLTLVEATSHYLLRQVAAGAEVVQLFDSWAGVLSAAQFQRWVIAPTAAIVRRLKAEYPRLPVIGFPRGAGLHLRSYVEETGIDAVSLDASVKPQWAARYLQRITTIQGNLDNRLLVAGGRAMDEQVDDILGSLAHGRFVFNLSHGIVPETPPAHVARLSERLRQWRAP